MFLPTKEVIYGKAVFDYLLLPNRGYLFTTNNTREKPQTSTNDKSSLNSPVPLNKENNPDEPSAFSLGSILTDNFSNITDDNINSLSINNDKLYRWDFIDNDNSSQAPLPPQPEMTDKKASNTENRKLPSLEELTKEREKLFKDII